MISSKQKWAVLIFTNLILIGMFIVVITIQQRNYVPVIIIYALFNIIFLSIKYRSILNLNNFNYNN